MSDPRKDLRLDFLVQELTKMAEKIDGVIARSESNCVDEVVAEAKAATQQVKAKFLQLTGEIEHLKQWWVFNICEWLNAQFTYDNK